jgi:hypothetical protein
MGVVMQISDAINYIESKEIFDSVGEISLPRSPVRIISVCIGGKRCGVVFGSGEDITPELLDARAANAVRFLGKMA